ncbi:MAG: DUF1853 family protein [Planctomycetota bacterium]
MECIGRYVRDLLWTVNSPALVRIPFAVESEQPPVDVEETLHASQIDAVHLAHVIHRPDEYRVGRYFERLVVYWVQFIRACEIVAHGLPIREGKRTVGEIDLVFRDELGHLTHWEIAVKFYLQVNTGQPPAIDYVGPNANDTLARKTTRLRDHQLPLSRQVFPEVVTRHAFVKGRIFYHWSSDCPESATNLLSPAHLVGKWLRANEVEEFLSENPLNYRVLRKPFWLAEEHQLCSEGSSVNASEMEATLREHFSRGGRPILLSGFPASSDTVGSVPIDECVRIFVVPDDWPS